MKARLFLALWPNAAVRAQLVQWRDGWTWPHSATPVAAERLHVTLHFLGEVERALLPELSASLRVDIEPFSMQFGRNAVWHRGLAVLEPHTVPPQLAALHARLAAALHAAGVPPEVRPYAPHVTLSRRAGNASAESEGPAIEWPVTGYALVESSPHTGYTVLQHYP